MASDSHRNLARPVGWSAAGVVLAVAAVILVRLLTAQRPGDGGPVIGPAVLDKVAVGVLGGIIAVVVAMLVSFAVTRLYRHRP